MSLYTSTYQFQGVQGPTDPMLTHNAVEGYQPVSRIGEVVINAFSTFALYSNLPCPTKPFLVAFSSPVLINSVFARS
jgi:hypothetical protein